MMELGQVFSLIFVLLWQWESHDQGIRKKAMFAVKFLCTVGTVVREGKTRHYVASLRSRYLAIEVIS
jgi:hypothetical protein